MTTAPTRRLAALLVLLALAGAALLAASAQAALPDPMARGPYTPTTVDPVRLGTIDLQEPNAAGGATTGAAAAATVQLRGSIYYPADRASGSPVIVLVHGNHSSCDSGSAPNCTAFKRNDRGYAYLGENLATWGYTVFSLDQDQLIFYQDNNQGKGMHQRRLEIAASLDALYDANLTPAPTDANHNLGGQLVGKLDMTKIGLMGHSRGGDAVTSFIDYNRDRPAPGRMYPLSGVIAVAPTDYERRAPYGVPFATILPMCDGDVSNIQGARFFERGQYISPGDPFPKIQFAVEGADHNFFNSVWFVDGDDATTSDPACSTNTTANPNSIRLSGGTYTLATRGSGDPTLMGDQEKIGLALMSEFFKRYVGGDTTYQPYMTGELSAVGDGQQLPSTACPTSPTGAHMACNLRLMTSYFPGAPERLDVIRPESENPLTVSALGTSLSGSGFVDPYTGNGGTPDPGLTPVGGYDWCNPDPDQFAPGQLGIGGNPMGAKPCPLPPAAGLGGQNGTRENSPVNNSYGLQLALAWNDPVGTTGAPAKISTLIPAANADVRGFKSLSMGAAVNYFDTRNPARTPEALWNPGAMTQDFSIRLTDTAGHVATVAAGNPRYGGALHPTIANVTARVHVLLNQIRVPLADFTGVDLSSVRKLELVFGEAGKPISGSIQLADVRFQETADAVPAAAAPSGGASAPAAPSAPAGGGGGGSAPVAAAAADPVAPVTVDAPSTATPLPAAAPVCADLVAPTATIAAVTQSGGKLTVRGRATDTGCGAGVAKVAVALVKAGAKTASYATATGTGSWTIVLGRGLKPGSYTLRVRVTDAAGNVSTTSKTVRIR